MLWLFNFRWLFESFLLCRFGGDSSSSNPTTNQDGRVVGGDDSVNTSTVVSGSGNTITNTDFGAVEKSIELAKLGVETANKTTQTVASSAGDMLSGVLGVVGKQQQEFTQTIENIKGNDVRILVGVGVAVVGLAAVKLFNK